MRVVHPICVLVIMKNTEKKVKVKSHLFANLVVCHPKESFDYCKHVLQPVKEAPKWHKDFSQRENLLLM